MEGKATAPHIRRVVSGLRLHLDTLQYAMIGEADTGYTQKQSKPVCLARSSLLTGLKVVRILRTAAGVRCSFGNVRVRGGHHQMPQKPSCERARYKGP